MSVIKNISLIHPQYVIPSMVLCVSGDQYNGGYQDILNCYPWKNTVVGINVTGYEHFNTILSAYISNCSFNISAFNFFTDDYTIQFRNSPDSILYTTSDINYISYTFYNPSIYKEDKVYHTECGISYNNLYDYNSAISSSNIFNISAFADIKVLERPPEARFYIKAIDNKHDRMWFFCNNNWGRPCPESYITTETRQVICEEGWGGYTTQTRTVTVLDDVITEATEWESLDNYCAPFLWAWNKNGDINFSNVTNISAAYSDITVAFTNTK